MEEAEAEAQEQVARQKEQLAQIEELLDRLDELIETFNWGLDFAEIMTLNGGFDLVIGNQPYGVFTALGLTILRTHGTLCYIMSDTWQTIRTHKELRDQLLAETDVRYLVSVPNDTFKATVNPRPERLLPASPDQRAPADQRAGAGQTGVLQSANRLLQLPRSGRPGGARGATGGAGAAGGVRVWGGVGLGRSKKINLPKRALF